MSRVVFIRHGATAGNLQRRYIGRTDEPLCEEGVRQITALQGEALRADRVFVSPMKRTRQTAELLFPGAAHMVVEDLRETDFGLFEGRTAAELADCPAYRHWVDGWCRGAIPGGEAVAAFKQRTCAAFRQAMGTVGAGQTAVFVVHGGTIMAILEAFGTPQRGYYDYHIGNGQYLAGVYENGRIKTD